MNTVASAMAVYTETKDVLGSLTIQQVEAIAGVVGVDPAQLLLDIGHAFGACEPARAVEVDDRNVFE